MDIVQIKKQSIKDFLAGMNIHPKRNKHHYGMYYSPFREEHEPSMKVDYGKNLWYDFGSGDGGSIIDLVMKMHGCTFPEAKKKLDGREIPAYSFPAPARAKPKDNATIIRKIVPLSNTALIGYLAERKINPETARRQCCEVYYSVGGKHYFAIGFPNDLGGYELRNRYFKGTVSPKGITTFDTGTAGCIVFEGFMDYLSYLTIGELVLPQADILVLNSLVHLDKAVDFFTRHTSIHSFLDNDEAGMQALSVIRNNYPKVINCSEVFSDYKDLNAFLCRGNDEDIQRFNDSTIQKFKNSKIQR